MTEADFEYLIRTLSEARSRATEITVAVRTRAGSGDRLASLGHSAVSNIEKLLQDVREFALEEPQAAAPRKESSAPAESPAATQAPVKLTTVAPSLDPDHWVSAYVDELITRLRSPQSISFETAEQLLQHYKEIFLKDLEVARRMYRTYPGLFQVESSRRAGA
jgi:hypothetical protein